MRKKRIYLSTQKSLFDSILILVVVILTLLGLVIVYDSSVIQAFRDFGDSNYYIRQQAIWVTLGVATASFFAFFDYRKLKILANLFFTVSVALLLAVFIPGFGSSAGGAHRWLDLNFITIQPAEVFKLTAVIWLSTIFEKGAKLKPLVILLVGSALILGLFQKDLGSTVVFVAVIVSIYIVSGGPLWQIVAVAPMGIIGFFLLIFTSEYRKQRILAFLDPFSDTQGFTYHISQILIALGSGGLTGLGLGQSRQKFYIPEVTTDSIFAVLGEELGFLGGVFLITLFIILVFKGLSIAQDAKDNFGKILACGLTLWLGIQAIVNLGAMVSLFPLTGVPLPFISYGGSALVANLAAVGILLNISRRR